MKLFLRSAATSSLLFACFYIHFLLVHYSTLLKISGANSPSSAGYLIGFGRLTEQNSAVVFCKMYFGLFVLHLATLTILQLISYFRIRFLWTFSILSLLAAYSYIHETAFLIFSQGGSTWSLLDSFLVGLFGY